MKYWKMSFVSTRRRLGMRRARAAVNEDAEEGPLSHGDDAMTKSWIVVMRARAAASLGIGS